MLLTIGCLYILSHLSSHKGIKQYLSFMPVSTVQYIGVLVCGGILVLKIKCFVY